MNIPANHGGRSLALANPIRRDKLHEICCDFLICMGIDSVQSDTTAAPHAPSVAAPHTHQHIHLRVDSEVKRGGF